MNRLNPRLFPTFSGGRLNAAISRSRYSTLNHNSNNDQTCDVAIIGSGIMGLNTAYQIARRSPNTKIKLFEQSPGVGYGSTGASCAICRLFYTFDEMILMAKCGMNIYRNWNDYLQCNDASSVYTKLGNLVILPFDKTQAITKVNQFKKMGVAARIIDKSTMESYFPQINSDCGHFDNNGVIDYHPKPMTNSDYFVFEEDAGYFEPVQAVTDLRNVLRSDKYNKNVQLYYNTKVEDILHKNGKVNGVMVNSDGDGDREIGCEYVINCSGPWYQKVIDKLDGLDIKFTLKPCKIPVVFKDVPELYTSTHLEQSCEYSREYGQPIPVINDLMSGVYMRSQAKSKQILMSTLKEEEERDVVDPNDEMDSGASPEFRNKYLNSLYHRLEPITKPTSSKCTSLNGIYTVCEDDVHYLIGPTKLDGFIVCNGFSGHGFKCGPAVGSMLAQYITNIKVDGDTDVDMGFFSPYREPHVMDVRNVLA